MVYCAAVDNSEIGCHSILLKLLLTQHLTAMLIVLLHINTAQVEIMAHSTINEQRNSDLTWVI